MARNFTPLEWRFWPKVRIRDGCWEWIGSKDKLGYGRINSGGHTGVPMLAHRVAYEDLVGPIGAGLELDHTCHNPACVNPEHLRPCLHQQNLCNQKKRVGCSSRYKGVCYDKGRGAWVSHLTHNGRQHFLGRFGTEEQAHAAYCAASLAFHGEYSHTGGPYDGRS